MCTVVNRVFCLNKAFCAYCSTRTSVLQYTLPFSKSKLNLYEALTSDRVNLVAPASPVHRARYSTNWDRKGWPGKEIQMYYGCPWVLLIYKKWVILCHLCKEEVSLEITLACTFKKALLWRSLKIGRNND